MADAVCLFAQYDPASRVRPHVLDYLSALRASGYAVHLACSGSERLADGDAQTLAALQVTPHLRPNAGFDFGAWRDLLRAGVADGAGRILLANDSVFGPIGPLAPAVERMRGQDLDAWGMVESREHGRHLQSWFIDFAAPALAAPAVARVFDQPFEAMGKREVVARGELALGAAMRAEGLRFAGLAASRHRVNPMHYSWRSMLAAGVPFLKAELIRDNPWRIGWAHLWRREAERRGYSPERIDTALGAPAGRPWVTPVPKLRLSERVHRLLATEDHGPALRALLKF